MYSQSANPQQLLNHGMQHMQSGAFQQALVLFTKLEQMGMRDPRLYRLIGCAFERLERHAQAAEYFQKSLDGLPNQADLHYSLGNMHWKLGFPKKALPHFEQACLLAPEQLTYRQRMAECYLACDDPIKAETQFRSVIQKEAVRFGAYIGLARALKQQGQETKGLEVLQSASQRFPDNDLLLTELGWWYKNKGEYFQAAEMFERLWQKNQGDAERGEDLALTLLDLGKSQQALDTVQTTLKLNPRNRKLLKLAITLSYELGQENHLAPYQAIPLANMSEDVCADYIFALIRDEQVVLAQQLIEHFDSNYEAPELALSLRVALLKQSDEHTQIIAAIEGARSRFNLSLSHLEELVKAYLAVGNYQSALELATQLVNEMPQDQYYLALQSTALRLLDDPRYHYLCDYDNLVFVKPLILLPEQGTIESFNLRVKAALETLHITQNNPLDQSLRQGTQTPGTLFDRNEAVIRELRDTLQRTIDDALSELTLDPNHPVRRFAGRASQFSASWSVRLRSQGHHLSHVHPKGWYSSAYYVDLPESITDQTKQGWLHLGRPGFPTKDPIDAQRWVQPKAGVLVLFPSYYWHGTEAFEDEQARLTVAFDLVPKGTIY